MNEDIKKRWTFDHVYVVRREEKGGNLRQELT